MAKNDNKFCPLIKKSCKGSDCMWATKLRGADPQTGQEFEEELCSIVALPHLLIENTKVASEVGAAVESARNEAVKGHGEMLALQMIAAKIIPGDLAPRLPGNQGNNNG